MFDKIETLHDLFEVKLQGLYDAEKQLVTALPKMAAQATDPRLRMNIENHLRETETHVQRLEQVASSLNLSLNGPDCAAMEGLIEEGNEVIGMCSQDDVRDAAIISAAQAVEHFEIAQYGTVVYFAKCLGYHTECELLGATLAEEKKADEMLNEVAVNSVDLKAVG